MSKPIFLNTFVSSRLLKLASKLLNDDRVKTKN